MSNETDHGKPPADDDSAALDPYTEYLQLAPGPRPPHLYDLLQLELFCPHPERIEHAVRLQFRKIKPYEEHPDHRIRERIQDVMSHIATARVVLTDPVRRQEYDELLARRLHVDRDAVIRTRTAARLPEFGLRILAGPARVGAHLELLPDRVITLGSDAASDVPLPGPRVPATAARLTCTGEDWRLECTNPKNVILVNDQRCTHARVLDADDEIEVTGYRIRYEPLDKPQPKPGSLPPALSLIIRQGPSIPEAQFSAIDRASILLGSDATALWRLYGNGVALHHARIHADAALWEIHDLQSETGTWLNDERIDRAILGNRDLIRIGDFLIQVRLRG